MQEECGSQRALPEKWAGARDPQCPRWPLADGACGMHLSLVEILALHVLDFQFHLEFFDIGLVKVFGDTFNVFIQLIQLPFHFFEILLELL